MKKKYKYVVVSGCSFTASDAPNLPKKGETYGDLIAKHFGAKHYNLAESGGSVYYVNRTILEWCGKNKDKLKDTLIILGMPCLDRWTLWSNKFKQWVNINIGCLNDNKLNEFFHFFNTEDMKKYVKSCWNENDQLRSAINIIVGLQSFFKVNNIDHVFFDASANPPYDTYYEKCCDAESFGGEYSNKLLWDSLIEIENWYKHPEYKSMVDFTISNMDMRASKDDPHPNKEAHKYWADCLIEYIDEKFNT